MDEVRCALVSLLIRPVMAQNGGAVLKGRTHQLFYHQVEQEGAKATSVSGRMVGRAVDWTRVDRRWVARSPGRERFVHPRLTDVCSRVKEVRM